MPLCVGGGGSVLTQHQSRDTETDQSTPYCDGSSGRHGTLLQISYFTANLQYTIFYKIILGLGKSTNSQDRFPAIQYIPSLTQNTKSVHTHEERG